MDSGVKNDRGVGCRSTLLVWAVLQHPTRPDLVNHLLFQAIIITPVAMTNGVHHQLSKGHNCLCLSPSLLTNVLFPSGINNLINTLYTYNYDNLFLGRCGFISRPMPGTSWSITNINLCKTQHTATNIHLQHYDWPKSFGFFLVLQPSYKHSMFRDSLCMRLAVNPWRHHKWTFLTRGSIPLFIWSASYTQQ